MKRKNSKKRARVASLILLCAFICLLMPISAKSSSLPVFSGGDISAESAILIDLDQKSIIFEKNSKKRMGEASTTKIMTALVVAERLPLNKKVTVPSAAVGVEGSSVYLCEGEILTVRELLLALLLESANDAAVALAIATAGSVESFSALMNSHARELGLCDTHFCNPHGLFDEDHYTTAQDLALISAAALENEDLREIFATKKTTVPCKVTATDPDGDGVRYLKNHNRMLSLYEGAIGLKTGYTKATGRCLVSAAERDGMTLIAVTLNAPDDWRDHTAMLDYGFSAYERVTLLGAGELRYSYVVSGGEREQVIATNSEPIILTLPRARESTQTAVCFPQRFEIAPISKGEELGCVTVSCGGLSASSPLVAYESVERAKRSKFELFT
ncbi:MAG: D-alanyl-D-alanine carboxypeptidase [Clostridia bacterium]|nr:D-alanyl-D-alanine carboxypeptidase [Clostridia bacterium]